MVKRLAQWNPAITCRSFGHVVIRLWLYDSSSAFVNICAVESCNHVPLIQSRCYSALIIRPQRLSIYAQWNPAITCRSLNANFLIWLKTDRLSKNKRSNAFFLTVCLFDWLTYRKFGRLSAFSVRMGVWFFGHSECRIKQNLYERESRVLHADFSWLLASDRSAPCQRWFDWVLPMWICYF